MKEPEGDFIYYVLKSAKPQLDLSSLQRTPSLLDIMRNSVSIKERQAMNSHAEQYQEWTLCWTLLKNSGSVGDEL